MMLFARCVSPVVFGFDYGSEFIKVGMALPGKAVHVALNQQSKRLSPSYFSFWNRSNQKQPQPNRHWNLKDLKNCSWAFCDAAKSHAMRFPQTAIKGMLPLLGEENGFTRRESLALVLRHLITTVDEGKWKPEKANLVFTVEPTLSRKERLAIKESCRLINSTITGIVDSPLAAAKVYALEKQSLYENSTKYVAFIDIGATHTWGAVFRIRRRKKTPQALQLSVSQNFTLGGNLIDQRISDHLISLFEQRNNIKVTDDRTKRQFYEEAKRAKEKLTVNTETDIKMEDVIDDYGLTYSLTRSKFNEIISDLSDSIADLYHDVVNKANVSRIDSIELIGGTTRVPFVMQSLMNCSGMMKLNRTMNSDEVLALGAAYEAASKSGEFLLANVKMSTFSNCEVHLQIGDEEIHLFSPHDKLSETRTLSLSAKNFSIVCDGDILMTYSVGTDESYNVTFGFDSFSIPVILNSTRRFREIKPDWMLTEIETKNSWAFIKGMDRMLKKRRSWQQVKNDFEALNYKIKERLEYDEDFKKVLSEKERNKIEKTIKNNLEWYDEEMHSLKEYQARLWDLRELVHDANTRASEMQKRPQAVDKMKKLIRMVRKAINKTIPQSKPWIPKDKIEKLEESLNATRDWMVENLEKQKKLTECEAPAFTVSDLESRRKSLERKFNNTMKIPRPTPTPKPKPKKVKKNNVTEEAVNTTIKEETNETIDEKPNDEL